MGFMDEFFRAEVFRALDSRLRPCGEMIGGHSCTIEIFELQSHTITISHISDMTTGHSSSKSHTARTPR